MTLKNSVNAFISSANRPSSDSVCDFVVEFPEENPIKCNDNEYIKLNVVSFDMINAMYNIFNARITLYENDYPQYCDIPDGNYNIHSLKKWFQEEAIWYVDNILYGQPYSPGFRSNLPITYNAFKNTFSIKRGFSEEAVIHIQCPFLGFHEKTLLVYDEWTSGSYVNLVNYNKIILRTQNINYFTNNIENLHNNNNKLTFSDIIFWKSRADIEPFKNISYSNEDSGNSFNLILQDKTVTNMRLQLKNELGDFITNAPDYLLVLQFSIHYKEEQMRNSILTIAQNIRDIWVSLLWVMEKLKLLQK